MSSALYCSLGAVQRETGNSNSDNDVWFTECITGASRWIDDYCLRDFGTHDHATTAYQVPWSEVISDTLFVPWPIITLTEVKVGETVIPVADYFFEVGRRSIRKLDGSLWSKTDGVITLAGTFGYASPPSGVVRACVLIASAWSHEKRRERVDLNGQRTSLLDDRVPDDALTLLRRFRKLTH